jgi:hypothetical protein
VWKYEVELQKPTFLANILGFVIQNLTQHVQYTY